jgi:spore coat polysaccharide biosynthesis protein SpsF (cytidylyltransferase family)
VTPYIKNCGKFTCDWKKSHKDYNFKLSVDSPDDFVAVKGIFDKLSTISDFGIEEVVELIQNNPELLEANKESIINSGYQKSLDNDKRID